MQKTIRVEFNGLASGTTASVKVEYTLEGSDTEKYLNEDMLQEVQELYNKANKFAEIKTLEKAIKR